MAVTTVLTGTTQTISATNGSANITFASGVATNWVVGATIQGTGITAGTKILSITGTASTSTAAVLSTNFTGTTGSVSVIISSNTGTLTVTLAASGDTASPQTLITNGFGVLRGTKTIEILGFTKIILQIATGATWDDTEWVYELGAGSSLRMNETYGCGTWRSGYILNGATYVKAKGATINYNNFDGSTGAGGRNIFFNSGAPTGYPTSKPTYNWNDISWNELGGSNAAAILATAYGTFNAGRIVMDYSGDSAGANAGIGGSFGTIESLLLYRCIGGVSTGIDTTQVVTIGKFEYFSLPATGTEVRMAMPNNVPFYGFAPLTYQVPSTDTYICANTTSTETLRDYTFPTNFDIPSRSKNYSANIRTYERKVNMPIKDSSNVALTNTTVYIKSGVEILKNAILSGDLNEYIQAIQLSWLGRSPSTGSYILPISYKDTEAQTAQFRKNGYVAQTVSYDVTNGNYFQPIFLLTDAAYGSVTPTQAAALTGIALDYTNKVITGSNAKNLDELYAFGQYSQALTANSAQADFQQSSGGVYSLLTTWKIYWTAGALTMGTYNKTFNSSTQWKFGNTASLTLNKKDVTWTPTVRGDVFQFESGSTFNLTNGSTFTISPTATLGYGSATTSEFRSGSTLNMSDSTVIYNIVSGGSGTVFSNSEAGATWNISNSTLTLNCPNGAQVAIHAYFLPASTINNFTVNGTASNVIWQMGYLTNNSKMVGFKYGGAIFGNGTSNVLMDTYTYTGALTTIPNTFGSNNKWYWVDPVMNAGGLFRWAAGSTPTGSSGFYGVIGFRPTITMDKTGYAPKVRFTPSAMSSRYPSFQVQSTAFGTLPLTQFFKDPTFMGSTDGFLPFVDSLDDKTVINTIDWTVNARQAGWIDQTTTFTAATAKKGLIVSTFSGAADSNYVNASTALADSALITVNTSTKTIAPVSGNLSWSPQRLYNALKNWWATYASDTDFLVATGGGYLDLGDYNTSSTLKFTSGNSNDALVNVRTTGLINAPINDITVTDANGTSTIWQFGSTTEPVVAGTSIALYDASGNTVYYNVVTTNGVYTKYIPTGTTGTYYYAIERYGYKREEGNFPANAGGTLFYVPNYSEDVGITANYATANAWTDFTGDDTKIYDGVAVFRLSETGIKLGQLVTRDGTSLVFTPYNVLFNDQAINKVAVASGTITLKALTINSTTKYDKLVTSATKTILPTDNELINVTIEDANGDSKLSILGGDGAFELWKVTTATATDDYATGTKLTSPTIGNTTYRFIGISGYDIVGRDISSGVRRRSSMIKGVYTQSFYVGDQIQLANNSVVDEIKIVVDEILLKEDKVMGAMFNDDTDSLSKISDAIDLANGKLDLTPENVWEYTTRTLTSSGASGATIEEIEASAVLAKKDDLTIINNNVKDASLFIPASRNLT